MLVLPTSARQKRLNLSASQSQPQATINSPTLKITVKDDGLPSPPASPLQSSPILPTPDPPPPKMMKEEEQHPSSSYSSLWEGISFKLWGLPDAKAANRWTIETLEKNGGSIYHSAADTSTTTNPTTSSFHSPSAPRPRICNLCYWRRGLEEMTLTNSELETLTAEDSLMDGINDALTITPLWISYCLKHQMLCDPKYSPLFQPNFAFSPPRTAASSDGRSCNWRDLNLWLLIGNRKLRRVMRTVDIHKEFLRSLRISHRVFGDASDAADLLERDDANFPSHILLYDGLIESGESSTALESSRHLWKHSELRRCRLLHWTWIHDAYKKGTPDSVNSNLSMIWNETNKKWEIKTKPQNNSLKVLPFTSKASRTSYAVWLSHAMALSLGKEGIETLEQRHATVRILRVDILLLPLSDDELRLGGSPVSAVQVIVTTKDRENLEDLMKASAAILRGPSSNGELRIRHLKRWIVKETTADVPSVEASFCGASLEFARLTAPACLESESEGLESPWDVEYACADDEALERMAQVAEENERRPRIENARRYFAERQAAATAALGLPPQPIGEIPNEIWTFDVEISPTRKPAQSDEAPTPATDPPSRVPMKRPPVTRLSLKQLNEIGGSGGGGQQSKKQRKR